ncbi:hypothetical protein [Methylorubrum extorquens]
MIDTKIGASNSKDDPAAVAGAAFAALQADSGRVVTGLKNKVMSAATEALPDRAAAALNRGMPKPGSAD